MDFLKHKLGVIIGIVCLIIVVLILWYCFFGNGETSIPEGTLVEVEWERNVV